jgi:hypothetical protein
MNADKTSGVLTGVKMIGGVKREGVLLSSNIAESCDEKRSIVERACGTYAYQQRKSTSVLVRLKWIRTHRIVFNNLAIQKARRDSFELRLG